MRLGLGHREFAGLLDRTRQLIVRKGWPASSFPSAVEDQLNNPPTEAVLASADPFSTVTGVVAMLVCKL